MSRNAAQIKAGLAELTYRPYEVISGTVIAGSVDTTSYTVSVQPTGSAAPIKGVLLSTLINDSNGLILIPADNSNVIIASIDGPGQWSVIQTSDLTKALLTIGNVQLEIDSTEVNIQNGAVVLNISDSVFKINTPGESLYQLLKDFLTQVTEITVPTPAGTSSPPVNAPAFNTLLTRLDNLLTH